MQRGLTLSARLAIIVLIGFLAAWLTFVTLFFRFSSETALAIAPAADRLLAIARVIETTPPDRRGAAFAAIDGPRLVVGVAREPPPPERPVQVRTLLAEVEAQLAVRLAGRDVAVGATSDAVVGVPLRRLLGRTPVELVVHVGLTTGETLVVRAGTPYAGITSGVPVGTGAGLLGLLIAGAAVFVMWRETRPLSRLAGALDRVDLSGRAPALTAPKGGAPEIRAVVVAVNRLQERLAGLMAARLAMIGGISHDVRTFATRLRLKIDGIADESERARAAADIDDMIRLLDDALLAARAGAGELVGELTDLDEVVAAEVGDRPADDGSVTYLRPAATGPVFVLGDRLALRRVVANLIDNALKYGDTATVRLETGDGVARLAVEDDGPGIPEDRRLSVFEPFVRLEASRARATGGAGLGLAVVRSFAEAMGGTVAAEAAAGGGARLVVTLPLFRPED
jgi:signal transduction histidine kinase